MNIPQKFSSDNPSAEEIAQALACDRPGCGCGKRSGRGWKTHCPAHDDQRPSLLVWDADGRPGVKCLADCHWWVVRDHLQARGLWPQAREKGGEKPEAVYPYHDPEGRLLFEVCRFRTPDGGKTFRQRRPDPANPGEFIWNLKGVTHVLYRLPQILQAPAEEPVFIVEGEKDADRLADLDLTATTNPCGAGKWRREYTPHLKDRHIVILPDNDAPGREHAQKVARALHGVAASVKMVELPGLPPKGDVSDWLAKGGTRDELLRLAAEAPEWSPPQEAHPTYEPGPLAGTPYRIENGGLAYIKQTREGPFTISLSNFVAQAVEEHVLDDGRETVREFVITGTLSDGTSLPSVRVPASEFKSMGWVVKNWGLKATITSGQAAVDRVREAIQLLSQNVSERHIYTHTGWRSINGRWVYLHPGVNGIEVSLGQELNQYYLPAAVDHAEARAGAEASYELLHVAPWRVSAPLMAVTYLSPLADVLGVDFVPWLLGPSGSLKSTLAALILSHFGAFERTTLPGHWASTANALERRAFLLKDMLFVIDDYAPPATYSALHDLEAKAHRLCRAAGNRGGRQRLGADLRERQTYYPRALVLSTGELLPGGLSLLARIMPVSVERADVDLIRLTEAQNKRELLPAAIRSYVAWLSADFVNRIAWARALWMEYRNQAVVNGHGRLPEMVAWLSLGFRLFNEFMAEVGIISQAEVAENLEFGFATFVELAKTHASRLAVERPAQKFLAVLKELLAQRVVYFRGVHGEAPVNSELWGWTPSGDPPPGAECLGWVDADLVYLLPEAAFRRVTEVMRRQGEHLGTTKRGLFDALKRDGIILPGPHGENTWLKKAEGRPRQVLHVRADKLG